MAQRAPEGLEIFRTLSFTRSIGAAVVFERQAAIPVRVKFSENVKVLFLVIAHSKDRIFQKS